MMRSRCVMQISATVLMSHRCSPKPGTARSVATLRSSLQSRSRCPARTESTDTDTVKRESPTYRVGDWLSSISVPRLFFFFFQAEDGMRDLTVTGVQTCALPILGYFRRLGREVIYDAEHFFDGYRLDSDYALATLRAAAGAGADCIVLCDTNGGELPEVVEQRVRDVRAQLGTPLGIHPHNDSGLAVANALAAVRAGCVHVQGTINGYGERCGNLDLIPLIATLQLKLGCPVLPREQLRRLREVALFVEAVANLNPDAHAPYVGASAFAHKGGIHVAAVAKLPETYQHIDPTLVGNEMRVVVSELSGRQNVTPRAGPMGVAAGADVLQQVKALEYAGHQFEAADGSFEMLVRRSAMDYRPPFELLGFTVIVEGRSGGTTTAQAMVQLRVDGRSEERRVGKECRSRWSP